MGTQALLQAGPFHPGEGSIQMLAGVRAEAEQRGQKMLTAKLAKNQRDFFRQSHFLASSHCDANGQPWAGLITGESGFIDIEENGNKVFVRLDKANNITRIQPRPGNALGLLGIDFESRRRNRLKATVFSTDSKQLRMIMDQGYGNCPKHNHPRRWQSELFDSNYRLVESQGLSDNMEQLIARADTFFIASSSGSGNGDPLTKTSAWGADISHRGGEPGFVTVANNQLSFDDYPGNTIFNTLGNLQQYPFCGLLFIDFDSGNLLQVAGIATLHNPGGEHRITVDTIKTRQWLKI